MIRVNLKSIVAGLAASVAVVSAAQAGGFDRGGVNVDLLFSDKRVDTEFSVTYVSPQRTINNVTRGANEATEAAVGQALAPVVGAAGPIATAAEVQAYIALNPAVNGATVQAVQTAVVGGIIGGGGNPSPDTSGSIDVDSDYVVPRVGLKVGVTDDISCLGTYTEPFGASADYGTGNAYSASTVAFSIDTRDIGLTCSYRFAGMQLGVGQSYFRFIGGVSYQELDGFQSRQRFLDFAKLGQTAIPGTGVTNTSGIGSFTVGGDAVGYRLGVAFEIPDIALRASLMYNSKYDYDLTGTQDNTGFGAIIPGTQRVPITMSTEIPQSVEFKIQSGIAPGTLAFASVKWQQWSRLGIIPVNGGVSPVSGTPTSLSFDPVYRDGWTITGGVGRKFNDALSGSLALTWDRGTATTTGTQTDTWTVSGGLAHEVNENVELRLGGAIGLLTSGSSVPAPGGDAANNVTYSFGNDVVYALSGALKVKF
ncbi:MAG: outer membrane protein transport protein [Hoeflea sp.]|uniref:outer membrane protein transport protein n=1 Tax=Hoeflea sp. TaxID=1940281 RepID=UPI00329A0B50